MFAAAVGALALFLTMFVSSERGFGMSREAPRPTSVETGGNGYRAAAEWLSAEKIRTVSVQESLGELLDRHDLAPTGNVIVMTLPVTSGFRTEDYRALDRWVRSGNTLLVMAALSDQPRWAHGFGGLVASDLNLLTGLQFQPAGSGNRPGRSAAAADTEFIESQRAVLVANRPHGYFAGVRDAVALSDFPREDWAVGIPNDAFVLALAHDQQTGAGVLWTRSLGRGHVVVSTFGSLFTNRALGLAHNARLLANIIGANLSADGAVLFDDIHQGLSAAYDPAKFYRDNRLYYTLGILIVVWLTWVLGSTRLSGPTAASRRGAGRAPREAELVRATGGFFSRVVRPDAAARRMFELFFQRLYNRVARARGVDGMPWSYLERHSQVAPADVRQLREWYSDACASRRVPLLPLHNLIVRMEGGA